METEGFFFRCKWSVSECELCPQYGVYAFMAYMQTPLHFKITYRKANFLCKVKWINKVIIQNLRISVLKYRTLTNNNHIDSPRKVPKSRQNYILFLKIISFPSSCR
jgi:hypothetical protein